MNRSDIEENKPRGGTRGRKEPSRRICGGPIRRIRRSPLPPASPARPIRSGGSKNGDEASARGHKDRRHPVSHPASAGGPAPRPTAKATDHLSASPLDAIAPAPRG